MQLWSLTGLGLLCQPTGHTPSCPTSVVRNMRSFIGALLCLAAGFALPLAAVVGWGLWLERRDEFDKIVSLTASYLAQLGLPSTIGIEIFGPVIVVLTLILIWLIAGSKVERAKWMGIGASLFAIIVIGLMIAN